MLHLLCLVCILSFKVSVMCEDASLENHLVSASRLNDLVGQLEKILKIEAVSKDKVSSWSSEDTPSSWTIVPPKYMIDLYHKYADDKFIWDTDPSKTTTIRCILGKVKQDSVHFNLSSLVDTKTISHAEIHVFRRTRRGKSARTKLSSAQHRIRLRNLPKKLFLSTIISLSPKRGWQAVDVLSTIQQNSGKGKFLSMTVEASIPEFGSLGRERYHTIPVDEVLRLAYRPFLVVFSTEPAPVETSLTSSSGASFPPLATTKTSMKKELTTSSSQSNWNNNRDLSPFEENYGESVDELENSLKSILNIDKVNRLPPKNSNTNLNMDLDETNKGFEIENNEIGERDSMDHFHLAPSSSQFQFVGKKIPLINHSHSMAKRSIQDNEFSEDPESPLTYSPHHHHQQQKEEEEQEQGREGLQKDSNENENSLNSDQTNALPSTNDEDSQFLVRQDNLDNGLIPSSSSSSSSPSSKESNPNPILPFPSRHRWWNQPLDHSWTSSSSKTRGGGGGGRRKGKTTNRRKKLRRNRPGKKYWTSERTSSLPTSSQQPPLQSSMDTTAKSQTRDAQLFYRESTSKTRKNSCRLEQLSVDTANLDWAESIIAPAVLPLNYCEGPCSSTRLTNSQGLADSSHEAMLDFNSLDLDYPSTLQSQSGGCCVPAAKKRLVVLFSDIHDSIILRIHPNVTTTSCQFL